MLDCRRLRRTFEEVPVEVVNAVFEDWEAEDERFDAVVAFTAFHWVDPETKYANPARLLRPGGALAVAETDHLDVRCYLAEVT
jgi:ubiquinone/menaquinone biosynthesis C-methylase UbiE